jgi:CheY-like chemotaxis protein
MKPTILVIDDDEAVRYSIRRIMQGEGFAVAVAANGREGIELLDRAFPALVITDLIMPEMEGLETITELRERRSSGSPAAAGSFGRAIWISRGSWAQATAGEAIRARGPRRGGEAAIAAGHITCKIVSGTSRA